MSPPTSQTRASARPLRAGREAARAPKRLLAFVALSIASSGCFALFELGEYGPPSPVEEAGPAQDQAAPPQVETGPPPGAKTVFVTRQAFRGGDLAGLAGADSLCTKSATDAGVSGTFKALLNDRESSIGSRLVLDAGPLVTRSGRLVAPTVSDLFVSGPRTAIDVDERGQAVAVSQDCGNGATAVWTGSTTDGGPASTNDCSRWSAVSGAGGAGIPVTDGNWISACSRTCEKAALLYCVQQ